MMERKATYAGKVEEKDALDILYWAKQKSPFERLEESWRLHCLNYNVPFDVSINKKYHKAKKRNG